MHKEVLEAREEIRWQVLKMRASSWDKTTAHREVTLKSEPHL